MSTRRLSNNNFIGLKVDMMQEYYEGSSYIAYDTEEIFIYNIYGKPVLVGKTTSDPSGSVTLNPTQDNEYSITDSGGLRLTKQTLNKYDSHALATADGSLAAGSAYLLTRTNIEGVPVSPNETGPVFRK